MFEPTEEQLEIARQKKAAMEAHTRMVDERTLPLPEGHQTFGSFAEDWSDTVFSDNFSDPEERAKLEKLRDEWLNHVFGKE